MKLEAFSVGIMCILSLFFQGCWTCKPSRKGCSPGAWSPCNSFPPPPNYHQGNFLVGLGVGKKMEVMAYTFTAILLPDIWPFGFCKQSYSNDHNFPNTESDKRGVTRESDYFHHSLLLCFHRHLLGHCCDKSARFQFDPANNSYLLLDSRYIHTPRDPTLRKESSATLLCLSCSVGTAHLPSLRSISSLQLIVWLFDPQIISSMWTFSLS